MSGLEQRLLETDVLQRLAGLLNETASPLDALERCLDLALEVAHTQVGVIYRYEAEGPPVAVATRGEAPDETACLPLAEDLLLREARVCAVERDPTGRLPLLDSLGGKLAASRELELRARGFRLVAELPLHHDRRLFGLLVILWTEQRELEESTLRTLEAVTAQQAAALAHLAAQAQAVRRLAAADRLREFGVSALRTGGEGELERLVVQAAVSLMEADAGLLARVEPDRARVMAAEGIGGRIQDGEVIEDRELRAQLERRELWADSDAGHAGPAHAQLGLLSVVCLPLITRQPASIVLMVGSATSRRWASEAVEWLQILGSMAAEAIERHRLRAAVAAGSGQLRAVLEHLPLPVEVLAADGRLIEVNAAGRSFNQRMKVPPGDWRRGFGTIAARTTDGREIAREDLPIIRAFAGAEPEPVEMDLTSADGLERISVLMVASPLREKDGSITTVVVSFQDVSELRELTAARDRFISIASHELRSPITSLRATASLLEMNPQLLELPDKGPRLLERIQRQGLRLGRLVDQLLDSARLTTGELPLEPVACDLVALAREAVEVSIEGLPEDRVSLTAREPVPGIWDGPRIEQVLVNLISNALRYSAPETVVEVRVERQGNDAIVEVRDHGIGIPSEELEHLFKPFYRAANATSVHRGGLGLGLHIASQIVREHGGELRARSQQGEGSTFTVQLPGENPGPDLSDLAHDLQ